MPSVPILSSRPAPSGVASMKLTRINSSDTLTTKHVELPGPPPFLSETGILVDRANNKQRRGATPTPIGLDPKPSGNTKDRDTSMLSIPDTVLSSVSTKMDAEALAWKEVPSVLRGTIKQILLVLQEHSQALEHLPTSTGADPTAELRRMQATLDELEKARASDRTYFEDALRTQAEKHAAAERVWQQRVDEAKAKAGMESEQYVKWEAVSERVRELEVRLFGARKKSWVESAKPITESLQVLPGSLRSIKEGAHESGSHAPELTDRIELLYQQVSCIEGRCQSNEDIWKQLERQWKQEHVQFRVGLEEWQSLNAQVQGMKSEVEKVQAEIPKLQAQIHILQSEQARARESLNQKITELGNKFSGPSPSTDFVSQETFESSLTALKSEWTHQVDHKVDTSTLTSLLPQLVTREKMKKYLRQYLGGPAGTSSPWAQGWKDVTALVYYLDTQVRQLQTEAQAWQVRLQTHTDTPPPTQASVELEVWKQAWTRDMDEKLYLMASEVRDLKSLCSPPTAAAPYHHRHPQIPPWSVFVWTTRALKQGSAIVWNTISTRGTTDDNQGEEGVCHVDTAHPHLILIPSQGVYAVSFAMFTAMKPSIQVVINGQSILTAMHSPTYTVHHENAAKSKKGNTVSGISLMDYINVPAHSKLSLHWHGGKLDPKVQGFIYLQKLV